MAEILINAEEVSSCVKYKSGKVCIWLDGVKEIREVPTHGDLKDANKILQWLNRICDEGQSVSVGEIIDYIDNAPTILEATE